MHVRGYVLLSSGLVCLFSDNSPQGRPLVTLDNIPESEKAASRFLTIA